MDGAVVRYRFYVLLSPGAVPVSSSYRTALLSSAASHPYGRDPAPGSCGVSIVRWFADRGYRRPARSREHAYSHAHPFTWLLDYWNASGRSTVLQIWPGCGWLLDWALRCPDADWRHIADSLAADRGP